jgi:hypothetical protein
MARSKGAGVVTGGGIDPYVAQSMQQNKALAENRLTTAMQQAGQTERQGMANRTQLQIAGQQARTAEKGQRGVMERAQMQSDTATQGREQDVRLQAAQLEAEDKRAAERIASQREDQNYQKAMMTASQEFQTEQQRLQNEYNDAVQEKDWERSDKIFAQMEEARQHDQEVSMKASLSQTNAILSLVKRGQQKETKMEQAKTVMANKKEEAEQNAEMLRVSKESTKAAFLEDKRMDIPFKSAISAERYGIAGSFGGSYYYPGRKEVAAKPLAVMQDQIAKQGSSISIEDLRPEKIDNLEKGIVSGEVTPEDIRSTYAVMETTLEVLDERLASQSAEGKGKAEFDFWKGKKAEVVKMRNALNGLKYKKSKVKGSDVDTVGSQIRFAIGNVSLGDQRRYLSAQSGAEDFDSFLEEVTKPLMNPGILNIEGLTGYRKILAEKHNAALGRVFTQEVN